VSFRVRAAENGQTAIHPKPPRSCHRSCVEGWGSRVRLTAIAFGLTRTCVKADHSLALICVRKVDDLASKRSSFCVATPTRARPALFVWTICPIDGDTGTEQRHVRSRPSAARFVVGSAPPHCGGDGSGTAWPCPRGRRANAGKQPFANPATHVRHASSVSVVSVEAVALSDAKATACSLRETALYPTVKAFLEGQAFQVKGEICGCYVVAVRDSEPPLIVIAELKLSFTLELVLQAVDRLRAADQVGLAVAASRRGRDQDGRAHRLCRLLGVGLLTVDVARFTVIVVAEPLPYRPRADLQQKRRLFKEHGKQRGNPTSGGSTRQPVVTAYRQRAIGYPGISSVALWTAAVARPEAPSRRSRRHHSSQCLRVVRSGQPGRVPPLNRRRACLCDAGLTT